MNNSQELVHAKLPRFDRRDGTVRARLQYNVHLFPVPDVKKNVSKRVQLLGSAGYEYVTILGKCGGADSWRRVASIDPSQSVAVLRLSVRLDDFPDRVQNWEYCGNLSRRRSVNWCMIIKDFTLLSQLSYVDAVLQHSLEPFQARNGDFWNSPAWVQAAPHLLLSAILLRVFTQHNEPVTSNLHKFSPFDLGSGEGILLPL